MKHEEININNSVFVILSFEGPDSYSMAGGLGVRVTNLAGCLAAKGYQTHLFFIGDPAFKDVETTFGGRLVLHRWCQWISQYYPNGVYQGEEGKLNDFADSIPGYVIENIIKPTVAENKIVVLLSEEWHTASVTIRLAKLLKSLHLRDYVVIFWNANNVFGFDRIDWSDLANQVTITTISRYMKHYLWGFGVNPLVIPNGIPKELLKMNNTLRAATFKQKLGCDVLLTKVARWDPDKRWNMAVEAISRLKSKRIKAVLIARGGIEAYGEEVLYNAFRHGLKVTDIFSTGEILEDNLNVIAENGREADVINLKFVCHQDLLNVLYHGADGVLANSGREPFGLVGLETMAAGGVAFTGNTGEDYAINLYNSVVLDTSDPSEIESYVLYLGAHPEIVEIIRKAARTTASRYTWEHTAGILLQKLEYQAAIQGLISIPRRLDFLEVSPSGVVIAVRDRNPAGTSKHNLT